MNKKIVLGLFLALIAIVAIGSVSAFDFGSFLEDGDNQNVTLDGIDFNIPDGFKEDVNHATVNEKNQEGSISFTTNGKVYEKDSTVVALLVANYGNYNVTDEIVESLGGDAKTIGNVDGYLSADGKFQAFSYAKDNKLVVISTNDESVIADFIVK